MVDLTQKDLIENKAALDALIKGVSSLTRTTETAYVLACKSEELDMRETLIRMAAEGHEAQAALLRMRALGGELEGDNVTRGGGT